MNKVLGKLGFGPDESATSSRMLFASDPARNTAFPDNTLTNTKYTWYNFIPKNLLEQFSRAMNRYFLFIACLQLISVITPVSPISTFGPLAVIFAITAIKELVDDRFRASQDKIANERKYKVVRDGRLQDIMSKDILVGDIIRLTDKDEVPCDMCLIYSSAANGICFVQTTNLDGETNLKTRQCPKETQSLDVKNIEVFKGSIECAAPDHFVYKFDSRMWLNAPAAGNATNQQDAISLSGNQFLQQTITIKNVDFIYGVAVYTGNQTKFSKNKDKPPIKWTKADKLINNIAVGLFLFQLGLVIIFGALGLWWEDKKATSHWYLRSETNYKWYEYLIIPARFLLLNSTIIPISLKVTLDFCKMFYAKFIGWDMQMVEPGEEPAVANNSSISEDLGQIEFVLSDKTGTLTQNSMVFQKATVDGVIFTVDDINDDKESKFKSFTSAVKNASLDSDKAVLDLVLNMVLNNGVQPTKKDDGKVVFRSASPDEEALVQACADVGVVLLSREGPTVEINVKGQKKKFMQLQELEFTSNRKRMSVVTRDLESGVLYLYVKGADDVIYERLRSDQDTVQLRRDLDDFAREGLRTLVYGYRVLSDEDYTKWFEIYQKAKTELVDREVAVEKACELLERDFYLTGATAIEDKLQVDVADTISSLREAGIRFWMLTGDKFNTALQIATSCAMKRPEGQNSKLYEVAGDSVESVSISLENSLRDLKMTDLSEIDVCMITRGDVLPFALAPENKQKFLELGLAAHSVICCRFAPRQKADVVNMVKEAGKMTLAIGDGGNDVVMIQAAHIGVGIRGKEGLQAARAADYQINYFRYLKRLVLVHGHYSFERTGFVGQYSYYKSFLFCFFQIAYGFYTGFSGNSLFDSACITAYNVLLFFPIISFVLDQDLRPDQLMTNPHVYKEGQKSINFNMKTYLLWNFRALVQGFIMFLLSIYCYQSNFTHINGGYQADYDSLGMVVFFAYLWLQSFTLFLELKYITLTNFIVIWFFHFLSIGLMVGLNYWLSFQSLHPYYATTMAMNDPSLWLSNILTVIFCLLPVIAVKYVNYNYFPREMDLLRLKLRTSDTSANAQPRGDALA